MPEGPEVRTIVDGLNCALKGKTLTSVTFTCGEGGGKYRDKCPSDYEGFTERLPLRLSQVKCRGKFIWFRFYRVVVDEDCTKPKEKSYIAGGLGMTGIWQFSKETPKHTCMTLQFSGIEPLHFVDQRHFANVYFYLSLNELECKLSEIGPDWLNDNISLDEFSAILTSHPRMNINNFLMNQKYVSGVGNYIKSEVLYRAKISPHRKVSDITKPEARKLYDAIKKVMWRSYENRGMSQENYVDLDGEKGDYASLLQVYRKEYDPRGNKVKAEKMGAGRTTYWVPALQV